MSLTLQNKFKININELVLILLSLTYAGISSNVFMGFRLVDFLIFFAFVLLLRRTINPYVFLLLSLWTIAIATSALIGLVYNNPFIKSDLRFFSILIFSIYVGYQLGQEVNLNVEKVFYRIMFFTLIMYCLIPLFDSLRQFYVPESFQTEEHTNTVFGPSTIIINYLYIYLVLVNKARTFWFYASYLIFAIIIYKFRISRTDLALMLFFFIWSIIFRYGDKIKLKHMLIGAIILLTAVSVMLLSEDERLKGIFNPGQDTSFVYRILSNNEFLRQFTESSVIEQIFGFGMGSTLFTHFNDWFGDITLTILDNGPLTVMMKTGWLGLIVFIGILYYPLRGLSFKKKIIAVFPILLSMALFSHVIYNLLYILGFYFICFKLKSINNSNQI